VREHFVIGLAQWFFSASGRARSSFWCRRVRDAAAIKSSSSSRRLVWRGVMLGVMGGSGTCWGHLSLSHTQLARPFALYLGGANVYTSELCQLPLIRRLRVARAGYLEAIVHFCAAESERGGGGGRGWSA
jgi:hypothetical protein